MVKIFDLIDKVKKINPLILHYTNNVTITDCANANFSNRCKSTYEFFL